MAGIGGQKGFSGDGGPPTAAKLNLPEGIYVDHAGNLYLADSGNQRIQLVSPSGGISTLPGSGRDVALDRAGKSLYFRYRQ